jgi:hypothetical protein
MPANRGISALMNFPTFQEICSGCCTVAAQALGLLHPHKVRDDSYRTRGPGLHTRSTMARMFACAPTKGRTQREVNITKQGAKQP